LQTTWFIALGRIFDRSSGAYSINDFLATTVAYKGLFSKRALADRKRKAAGGEPPWLDDYLKTAWEPSTADLEGIAAAIKPAEAKYAKRYKAIRDKVFAHRESSKLAATLFEHTLVSDIEDILFTLNETMKVKEVEQEDESALSQEFRSSEILGRVARAIAQLSYRRHRFPASIIQHAIWLYLHFTLSYRNVEDLQAERGLDISTKRIDAGCWNLVP
jgi:hypothetical protein